MTSNFSIIASGLPAQGIPCVPLSGAAGLVPFDACETAVRLPVYAVNALLPNGRCRDFYVEGRFTLDDGRPTVVVSIGTPQGIFKRTYHALAERGYHYAELAAPAVFRDDRRVMAAYEKSLYTLGTTPTRESGVFVLMYGTSATQAFILEPDRMTASPPPDGMMADFTAVDGRGNASGSAVITNGGRIYPVTTLNYFDMTEHRGRWRYAWRRHESHNVTRDVIRFREDEGGRFAIETWPDGSAAFPPDDPVFVETTDGYTGMVLTGDYDNQVFITKEDLRGNMFGFSPLHYGAVKKDGDGYRTVKLPEAARSIFGPFEYITAPIVPHIRPRAETTGSVVIDAANLMTILEHKKTAPVLMRYARMTANIRGHSIAIELPSFIDPQTEKLFRGMKEIGGDKLERLLGALNSLPDYLLTKISRVTIAPPHEEFKGRFVDGGWIIIPRDWEEQGSRFSVEDIILHEAGHYFDIAPKSAHRRKIEAMLAWAVNMDGGRDEGNGYNDWGEVLAVGIEYFLARGPQSVRPALRALISNLLFNPAWQSEESLLRKAP